MKRILSTLALILFSALNCYGQGQAPLSKVGVRFMLRLTPTGASRFSKLLRAQVQARSLSRLVSRRIRMDRR